MDPLSIIAGTVGVADVCFRIITYLKDIKTASAKIQDEITILHQEVASLLAVNEAVEEFVHARSNPATFDEPPDTSSPDANLWKNLRLLLEQGTATIEQLEALLREVLGRQGTQVAGKLDGLRKTMRRKNRDGDYMQLRQRLSIYQSGLQTLLTALSL